MTATKTPGLAQGFFAGGTAYLIWGSFPLWVTMLAFADPWEIVTWRVVFGFVLGAVFVAVLRQWSQIITALKDRQTLLWLIVSTVMIYANWAVYVLAVAANHTVDAALGYFINPLFTLLLAVLFLKERLSGLQKIAVTLASIAVLVLTFDYGAPPWVALMLASSFSIYGLAKNKMAAKISSVNGYVVESGFLLPVAALQLFLLTQNSAAHLSFVQAGTWGTLGLIAFGFMTAIPLILFGEAAKRLPLSWVGLMQYLTPTLQFLIAVTIFREPMSTGRWIGFAIVWLALIFIMRDAKKKVSTR